VSRGLGSSHPFVLFNRDDYFLFDSVRFLLKKKVTKLIFLKKKTKTEPKPVQTDLFRFGYFRIKISSNRPVPVRFGLAQFFTVLARFFLFEFSSDFSSHDFSQL